MKNVKLKTTMIMTVIKNWLANLTTNSLIVKPAAIAHLTETMSVPLQRFPR